MKVSVKEMEYPNVLEMIEFKSFRFGDRPQMTFHITLLDFSNVA
jgi:hypothetical protein